MPRLVDHTGRRFGRLVALRHLGASRWLCACDCGNTPTINAVSLVHQGTQSCGCLLREITTARSTKHGHAKRGKNSNIFRRWEHMKQRCSNPNDRDYPRYGGRGIYVCDRWANGDGVRSGFECFLEDMGMPPSKQYSIDRIDVDGPYSPDNCRWATVREQSNNRRNTVMITISGVRKPLSYWCEQYNIDSKTVLYRMKHRGMAPDQAVTTPLTWTKRKNHASNS